MGGRKFHVAIPSSSGQCFLRGYGATVTGGYGSQSLLHQVSVSYQKRTAVVRGHIWVAIPSSSGQCFLRTIQIFAIIFICSRNPFFIRSVFPTGWSVSRWFIPRLCRNPFFIRSVFPTAPFGAWMSIFYCVAIPSSSGQCFLRKKVGEEGQGPSRRNPFFIRSVFPTHRRTFFTVHPMEVAIPSSSGQCFLPEIPKDPMTFPSLCRNPFFIRSVFPTASRPVIASRPVVAVAIPSSSGQCFLHWFT